MMQINNVKIIDNKLKCNKVVANYLVEFGFHPISRNGKSYYFKKNDNIMKIYNESPFYVKFFGKVVSE